MCVSRVLCPSCTWKEYCLPSLSGEAWFIKSTCLPGPLSYGKWSEVRQGELQPGLRAQGDGFSYGEVEEKWGARGAQGDAAEAHLTG